MKAQQSILSTFRLVRRITIAFLLLNSALLPTVYADTSPPTPTMVGASSAAEASSVASEYPTPKTLRELDLLRAESAATVTRLRAANLAIRDQELLVKRSEETVNRLKALSNSVSPEELQEASNTLEYRKQMLQAALGTLAEQESRLAAIKTTLKSISESITFPESDYQALVNELNKELSLLEEDHKRTEADLNQARSLLTRAQSAVAAIPNTPENPTAELLAFRKATVERLEERVSGISRLLNLYRDSLSTWKHRFDYFNNRSSAEEEKSWRTEAEERLTAIRSARNLLRVTADALQAKERTIQISLEEDTLEPPTRASLVRMRRLVSDRQEFLREQDRTLDRFEQLYFSVTEELTHRARRLTLANAQSTIFGIVGSIWNFELLITDGQPITLGKICLALVLVILGYFLSGRIAKMFAQHLSKHSHIAPGVIAAMRTLIFYALVATFALFALRLVSIPLTAFAFVGGALAVGIGFGSQHLVNNFISGLMLLIERPIRVGDVIEVGGSRGTVSKIGPRSVTLRTAESTEIIVPNSTLLEKNLVNSTFTDSKVRVGVRIGVAYTTSPELVREELTKLALAHPWVLPTPEPQVIFADFGENALIFELLVWVYLREGSAAPNVQSDLRFAITKRFKELQISFPFPQREVRMLS